MERRFFAHCPMCTWFLGTGYKTYEAARKEAEVHQNARHANDPTYAPIVITLSGSFGTKADD